MQLYRQPIRGHETCCFIDGVLVDKLVLKQDVVPGCVIVAIIEMCPLSVECVCHVGAIQPHLIAEELLVPVMLVSQRKAVRAVMDNLPKATLRRAGILVKHTSDSVCRSLILGLSCLIVQVEIVVSHPEIGRAHV